MPQQQTALSSLITKAKQAQQSNNTLHLWFIALAIGVYILYDSWKISSLTRELAMLKTQAMLDTEWAKNTKVLAQMEQDLSVIRGLTLEAARLEEGVKETLQQAEQLHVRVGDLKKEVQEAKTWQELNALAKKKK